MLAQCLVLQWSQKTLMSLNSRQPLPPPPPPPPPLPPQLLRLPVVLPLVVRPLPVVLPTRAQLLPGASPPTRVSLSSSKLEVFFWSAAPGVL